VDRLERAAWFGAPRDGVPGPDPGARVPPRVRWLAGVCLGATGRYAQARRWLAPGGEPAGSLAASCLASHLRQVGRHAEAEPLDRHALQLADSAEAEADALVGLVADAIGTAGPDVAAERRKYIPTVGRVIGSDTEWRWPIRVAWITAEIALCRDDFPGAVAAGRTAVKRARRATAPRHAVKSALVLGASLDAAGRLRPAARVLGTAGRDGAALDLNPLVAVACTLRADIVRTRAPGTAARERNKADSAQRIIEDPADGRMTR
jgi:hypothetical protein